MKKRIISWMLVICMTLTFIPAGVVQALAPKHIPGDADNNRVVDLLDVNLLERHLTDDPDAAAKINKKNADVNADGAITEDDITMIREYLVGNVALSTTLYTVTFDTDGGSTVAPIKAGAGYPYHGEIPTPSKEGYLFAKWVKEDGTPYYQAEDVISSDTTLKAVYTPLEQTQIISITSFSLKDQRTDVSFDVEGGSLSAEQVKQNITLIPKDGSEPVEVSVRHNQGNSFTVYAPEGFVPGASYELTLNEGLTFTGKEAAIRTAYFMIHKDEADNIQFNPDMIFIQDTPQMKYTIDGKSGPALDVLESSLLSNSKTKESITGSFAMSGNGLEVDDIVCIYEKTDPRNRDYTKGTYDEDALAYIRITEITSGAVNTYRFESLNEDDADEVLAMPDTLLYAVDTLPTGPGSVNKSEYDANARVQLGQQEAPQFVIGDILVFYTGSFSDLTDPAKAEQNQKNVVYGQIVSTDELTVSYKLVTRQDIENYSGMFVSQKIQGDELLKEIDQDKVLKNIKTQAETSGFAEKAAENMVHSALETSEFQKKLLDNGFTETEIRDMHSMPLTRGMQNGKQGRTTLVVEDLSVSPTFIKGSHFKNGIGVKLEVTLTLSVNTKTAPGKTSCLKIQLSAGFEEELSFSFDVNVDVQWKVYFVVPIIKNIHVSASVDVQNYTAVSVAAKMYTVTEENAGKWKAFSACSRGSLGTPQMRSAIRKINILGQKAANLKAKGEDIREILEKIEGYKDQLPKVEVDGVEYSLEQLETALKAEDVSAAFEEVFSAQGKAESKIGMDQLMEQYQQMLNNDCDWVTICDEVIFSKEFNIKVIAIRLNVNLVIEGNVNIAIGADVEYEVGKRYSFWLDIMYGKSGSSEIDLIDERFGFQFYVMGTMGLRVGIKAEIAVGLLSTRLASIGASVEFGPYLRLWGYFVYIYEKMRPINSEKWQEDEQMLGAIYLEFGLYVAVKFKAQVFDNLAKYEPTLYDQEFPLLTAGNKQNVYEFAHKQEKGDSLYIEDADHNSLNGVSMKLPSCYRNMKIMDLVTGDTWQEVFPENRFEVTFSDSRFTIDNNKIIHVDVPKDCRYLQCNMRIVWNGGKMAFSKYDIDLTVPVVWTNYTNTERNEKFTVSVAVGNTEDGYKTVWSDRYGRMDVFDLPARKEILSLINYDSYNTANGNAKYEAVKGYEGKSTDLSVTSDKTFYFDISYKQYSMKISEVQAPDGTKTEKVYTARYGDTFKMDDLLSTGTDNSAAGVYTSYSCLMDQKGNKVMGELKADHQFLQLYGANPVFTAKYRDDTLTATYQFVGAGSITPVEIKFKRGTAPDYQELQSYTEQNGAYYQSISPAIAPAESSVTYTVTCVPIQKQTLYTLSFETNGGEAIASKQTIEGALVIPAAPVRKGFRFLGWYRDAELNTPVEGNIAMPAHDLTLYAKWEVITYTITLNPNREGITLPNDKSQLTLQYGEKYGALPELLDATVKFEGWYTADGMKITDQTVFTAAEDQTVSGKWGGKKPEISRDWFQIAPIEEQTYVHDGITHPLKITAPGHEDVLQGITIQYQREKNNEEATTEHPKWVGTYNVKISRKMDNDYCAMEEWFLSAAIRINGKPRTSNQNLPAPKFHIKAGYVGGDNPNESPDTHVTDLQVRPDPACGLEENAPITYKVMWSDKRDGHYEEIKGFSETGDVTGNYDKIPIKAYYKVKFYALETDVYAPIDSAVATICYATDSNDFNPNRSASVLSESASSGLFRDSESQPVKVNTRTRSYISHKLPLNCIKKLSEINMSGKISGANTVEMMLAAEDTVINRGKTFDVTLQLEKDASVWGMLASVDYDKAQLELLGCSAGDIFTDEQFTKQEDLQKAPYTFLATLDTLKTTSAKGNFVTLEFRVKESAQDKDSCISISSLQAVDKTQAVAMGAGSPLSVSVDDEAPRITGIQDGGVYTGEVIVNVADDHLKTVTLNGKIVELEDGKLVLKPQTGKQKLAAEDLAGNTVTVTVTVNASDKSETPSGDGDDTTKPAADGNTPSGAGGDTTASTGDFHNPAMYAFLLAISLISMAGLWGFAAIRRKKTGRK